MIKSDQHFMRRALQLARRGRFTTSPNPQVGCVIVAKQSIVGSGYHQRVGEAHAEIHALQQAGNKARDATVYVTLEPCCHHGRTPPCTEALIAAGVTRVVVAMRDPNPLVSGHGIARLQQAGLMVEEGVLAEEAAALNPGFIHRMRTGLPYVRLKLAASLDGKTALASGESQWITSAAARQDVQCFRAESCAILSTSQTVLADDPALTVRWDNFGSPSQYQRQPIRVILDQQHRVPSTAKILQQEGETWLVSQRKPALVDEINRSIKWLDIPAQAQRVDLNALMRQLGKLNINMIWTEAGPTLAGALLQAGVVNELIVYLAPKLLGEQARGLCILPQLEHLEQAMQFDFIEAKQMGSDLRVRLLPK